MEEGKEGREEGRNGRGGGERASWFGWMLEGEAAEGLKARLQRERGNS